MIDEAKVFADCYVVLADCDVVGVAADLEDAGGICRRYRQSETEALNSPFVKFLPTDRQTIKPKQLTILKSLGSTFAPESTS